MASASERFGAAAAQAARDAIADAGGNEVFLLGVVKDGKIEDVRVLARGNRAAVPALLQVPRPSEVVIHNHPSGQLTPSEEDVQIASALGNNGVGFYIVDNAVREIYVVVEPLAEKRAVPVDLEEATRVLGPRGRIARTLEGYERRPQQIAMLRAVARSFNDDTVLSVEAGTGTGKSLAYLVPAILWSRANEQRVIVSTHTINLQEQLTRKDLPFLIERADLRCTAALVKGRGNYLCKRKAAQIESSPAQLLEDEIAAELRQLLAWARQTGDGSLADLPARPRAEVWEQVVSENDNCLRTRCPFYSSCFFYTARRAAAAADVLVVNHHLLMADLALRDEIDSYAQNAVLPPATRIVIDEAHHLEDVATAYFGRSVSRFGIDRILGRLQSGRHEERGILPALLVALESIDTDDDAPAAQGAARRIEERLLPGRRALGERVEESFACTLGAYAAHAPAGGEQSKLRVTAAVRSSPLWSEISRVVTELAVALDRYAGEIAGVLERVSRLSEAAARRVLFLATELRAQQGRLRGFAEALSAFLDDDESQCRWIELRRRRGTALPSFHVAPIEVAPLLRRALFDRFPTVVLTSATLTVGGRFDYHEGRLGIDRLAVPERADRLRLESPFDFAAQSRLLVCSDLPEPAQQAYEGATHTAIRRALEITGGGTFVLFTSYGALERAHAALAPGFRQMGLTVLKQGGTSRHLLLSQFVRERAAVLFATDSFWEGVDVRGEALRCVIIARLPFRVPTEPIEEARVERIERRGGNPFIEHAVPQAAIKLKQGFGRLIRSRDDRGCVLVLDSRLAHKPYGQVFLASLPGAERVVGPAERVFAAMRDFYGAAPARLRAPE